MMEANENDHHDAVQEQEQQQHQEAIGDDDVDKISRRRRQLQRHHQEQKQKLNSVLDHQESFPLRQRNKINDLVDEFLLKLKNDIHEMITDQKYDGRTGNYRGLDSSRDTKAEVETALRFFPENLTIMKDELWVYGEEEWIFLNGADLEEFSNQLPIHCLSHLQDTNALILNLKAIPFIHLFAELAIEFKLFEEEERGGLLIKANHTDKNVFDMIIEWIYKEEDDNYAVTELMELRRTGLLIKEDIHTYQLVNKARGRQYITFRFLMQWDPDSLMQTDEDGNLPLHIYTGATGMFYKYHTLQVFRSLFEYYVHYFPAKKGICWLFRKNNNDCTPIQYSCKRFGRNEVMTIVQEILAQYSSTTPINTYEALMLAAINGRIDVGCVYFLLRREPDILIRNLSLRSLSKKNDDVDGIGSIPARNVSIDDDININVYDNDNKNRHKSKNNNTDNNSNDKFIHNSDQIESRKRKR